RTQEDPKVTTSRKMLINGEWAEAVTGATYAVPNPATEEPVGHAPDAGVDDMRRAVAAARQAFDDGPWPRSTREERARALLRVGGRAAGGRRGRASTRRPRPGGPPAQGRRGRGWASWGGGRAGRLPPGPRSRSRRARARDRWGRR